MRNNCVSRRLQKLEQQRANIAVRNAELKTLLACISKWIILSRVIRVEKVCRKICRFCAVAAMGKKEITDGAVILFGFGCCTNPLQERLGCSGGMSVSFDILGNKTTFSGMEISVE